MTLTTRLTLALLAVAAATAACRDRPADTEAADPRPETAVTVVPVVRTTMHAYVEGWGRVEPEPAAEGRSAASARVTSPVAGAVTRVLTSEGRPTVQGAVLFRLDSRVADVAVERAQQAVGVAEQLFARQKELGPGQATSQKAYQEAQAQLALAQSELRGAELQRRLLDVRAPIAGTVVKIGARLGDAIDPSTVLAEVVDLGRLVVTAAIRSVEVARVRKGQRLEFSPGAGPGSPAAMPAGAASGGPVVFIGSQVDSATDTVEVRARVPRSAAVRPGQFVSVRVVVEERQDRLAVPVESLVPGEAGSEIAIVQGDTATRTPVKTGLREGGLVEVEGAGVRDGVPVVVRGAYGLPATSGIKVIGR